MESQVQLSEEFFSELDWWIQLLPEWNGVSVIPEFQLMSNVDFDLFTDASVTGFGACWQGAWLAGRFTDWAHDEGMAFKELFAIMMALATWGPQWQGKKIQFFAIIRQSATMLNFKNSCKPCLAALLHTLYALSVQFGCLISAIHLPGVMNSLADVLSCCWLQWFFELCPCADLVPTSIVKCNLDFSDPQTDGARWPCEDVSARLLVTCDVEDLLAGHRPLPSDDAAVWSQCMASGAGADGTAAAVLLDIPAL